MESYTGSEKQVVKKLGSYAQRGSHEYDRFYEQSPFYRPRGSGISGLSLDPTIHSLLSKIMKARKEGAISDLKELRAKLASLTNTNIILYDFETVDVPTVVNGQNGLSVEWPCITQFSFYQPLTGKHVTSYVKSCKPVSYEAGLRTGIYNSFNATFDLPVYDEKCPPYTEEKVKIINYENLSYMERPDFKEFESFFEYDGQDYEGYRDSLFEAYNVHRQDSEYPLKSLDDSPMFWEKIDDIAALIHYNDCKHTILLAHNGSRFMEPVFRSELRRACSTGMIDSTIIFADLEELFAAICINAKPECEKMAMRVFGESKDDSWNSKIDTLSTWVSIRKVFASVFGRNDYDFIMSKIFEYIFNKKNM